MSVGMIDGSSRYDMPGERGNIYLSDQDSTPPGANGQFTDAWIDGRFAIKSVEIADFIPEIGLPKFLWRAGDGVTPTIGSPLALTGALTVGQPTPWRGRGEDAMTSDLFDGTAYLSSAAPDIDPAAGHDLFVLAVVRRTRLSDATAHGYRYVIASGDLAAAGAGPAAWGLGYNVGNNRHSFRVRVGAAISSTVGTTGEFQFGAWTVLAGIMNDDANMQGYCGVSAPAAIATPAGAKASGLGTYLGTDAAVAVERHYMGWIRMVAVWHGPGIADYLEPNTYLPVRRAIRRLAGIQYGGPPAALANFSFQRTSHASFIDRGRRHHIIARSCPRSGDLDGLRSEPTGTNKLYRNVNPADGTTWTVDDASAVLVIDDSAALATVGPDDAACWGPNVFRYNNATGATRYMRQGPTMANTNKHSQSILARMVGAGPVAEIGWYVVATSTWTSVGVITDNYAETRWPNLTPPSANAIFCVKVQNNTEVRWIAQQCEETAVCNTITPNWATAAGVTRSADYTSSGQDIPDVQASCSVSSRSMCWGPANPATAQQLGCGSGTSFLLFIATGTLRGTDGTNNADVACTPSETTPIAARYAWKTTGPLQTRLTVNNVGDDTDTYDGAFGAGSFQLGRTAMTAGNWRTSRLLIHRNYQTGGGVA